MGKIIIFTNYYGRKVMPDNYDDNRSQVIDGDHPQYSHCLYKEWLRRGDKK